MVATVNNKIPVLLILISKTKLFVFPSVANSLELLLVEQILSNLTISKLKIDVVAKPTLSDNEDFFQRDVEAWELYYYYCNIKTWTIFFRLVVCMHMQSFKWFHPIILKIYTIFQYVKMLYTTCDVIAHIIWISQKCKYLKY